MRNLEEWKKLPFLTVLSYVPEGREISALEQGESYKYLCLLEAGGVLQEEKKAKLTRNIFTG